MDVSKFGRRLQQLQHHIIPKSFQKDDPNFIHFEHCSKQNTSFHSSSSSNVSLLDDEEYIEHQIHSNGCLQISLARQSALNAITYQMICTITNILKDAIENEKVQFVVIHSKNEKAYCAGGDIRMLRYYEYAFPFYIVLFNLNRLMFRYPKPIVALLHGVVMGGGVGLSIYCTYRVVLSNKFDSSSSSPPSSFKKVDFQMAMPECGIGLFTDIGACYALPQKCPSLPVAQFISLTSFRMNEIEAAYCNCITHIVNRTHFATEKDLLQTLCTMTIIDKEKETYFTRKMIEERLDQFLYPYRVQCNPLLQQQIAQKSVICQQRNWIEQTFDADTAEQILNQLYLQSEKKEEEAFATWSKEQIKILLTKCPTSVKVTMELNRRGGMPSATLESILQIDFRLVMRLTQQYNFWEGVRAIIIDKDNQPRWYPSELNHVRIENVKQMMEDPLEQELFFKTLEFKL